MKTSTIRYYFFNCFLLTIPVMLWNVVLTDQLPPAFQPEIFWKDIPVVITYGENIFRILVFGLALLMPLHITTPLKRKGMALYIAGLLLYFLSWLPLIYLPDSAWSLSLPGFLAPAYTPLLWLAGIGMVGGGKFYFDWPRARWLFAGASAMFLVFHIMHAGIVYYREII